MRATAAAAIRSFTSQPSAWEMAMGRLIFIKRELTTINGTMAVIQMAKANREHTPNENKWSHAQVNAKTTHVTKGRKLAQTMAFVSF